MSKNNTTQTTESTFLKGAMILSISMVVVKVIGMIYKIAMARVLGELGNGIFNIAYDIYNPLFMLATAGFPIAISRLVSENVAKKKYRDVRKIHKISIPIFIVAGIVCFVLLIIVSEFYVDIINASEAKLAIYTLAPTIFFGCLVSIYRGYYEGLRNMVPTAISEIIEASSKLLLGLAFAYGIAYVGTNEYNQYGTLFGVVQSSDNNFSSTLTSYTVAGAILGVTLGSFLAFLFLFLRYKIKGDSITKEDILNSPPLTKTNILRKRLIMTAIPVGLGAIVMSISGSIDTMFVQIRIMDIMNTAPNVLKEMYDYIDPKYFLLNENGELQIQKYLYGAFSYSTTLLMLITAVTQVFGTSALPSITQAWTLQNKSRIKSSIETVLKTTTLFTLPAGLGLCALAQPILTLIYYNKETIDGIQIATPVLQVMGISVLFIATSTPICSMLQAIGRVDLPLKLLTIGMTIKIILNYTLVGIPEINIKGAAVGSLVGYLFVCIVGIYFLCKETKIVPDFISIIIKPGVSAIACAICAYFAYVLSDNLLGNNIISSNISVIISIFVAGIVYLMFLFLVRGINKSDILMLPKGNSIVKALEKVKLIK